MPVKNTEEIAELIMSISSDFLQGKISEETYITNLQMMTNNL